MRYSGDDAQIYDSVGVKDTTYEIGYREVARLLGHLDGKIFLDFGAGTGRSSALLLELGAKRVVALDQDWNMVETARRKELPSVEFVLTRGVVPIRDASVDGAISLCVFVELRTKRTLHRVAQAIARAVKPMGPVVVMSTNPLAIGHTFRNFRFPVAGRPRSGERVRCTISSGRGEIDVDDTYWTEADYVQALESAGLSIDEVAYPMASHREKWRTEERSMAPFVVISASVTGRPAAGAA